MQFLVDQSIPFSGSLETPFPFSKSSGERYQPSRGERIFSSLLGGTGGYGWPGGWSSDRLALVSHYKHWVYIAINAIAKAIAGLAPNIAQVTVDEGTPETILTRRLGHKAYRKSYASKALAKFLYNKSLRAIKPHEIVTPLPPDHPLNRLLHKPNEVDTGWELWFELVMFLELCGNSYLWVVPNLAGLPHELWVIPAHWVRPRPGRGRLVDYYEILPLLVAGGGSMLRIPPEEIIHFKWKSPLTKIDGFSPQIAAAEWIDVDESIDRSRFWMMKNGCFPLGALELGEMYNDPDDNDINRIYAKFLARMQGETRFGMPLILPPGAKYTPLMINPQEMAYVESSDQIRDRILAMYHVPKEIAGIQDAGSEIAMYGPLKQFFGGIIPKLTYIGQVVTERLATRWDSSIRFWYDDPTPESPQQINEDIKTDLQAKAIAPDEVRAIRGRDPWPQGGDVPLGTPNDIPLPYGEKANADAGLDLEPDDGVGGDGSDSPEVHQTQHTADLLATVGGINGAIAIIGQVSAGTISRETAIQLFILFFGVSEDDAAKIIGDTKEKPPEPAAAGTSASPPAGQKPPAKPVQQPTIAEQMMAWASSVKRQPVSQVTVNRLLPYLQQKVKQHKKRIFRK